VTISSQPFSFFYWTVSVLWSIQTGSCINAMPLSRHNLIIIVGRSIIVVFNKLAVRWGRNLNQALNVGMASHTSPFELAKEQRENVTRWICRDGDVTEKVRMLNKIQFKSALRETRGWSRHNWITTKTNIFDVPYLNGLPDPQGKPVCTLVTSHCTVVKILV